MAKKNEQAKQTNWVFLPVHKTRIIQELERAILISVDYDRSTILPKVFKRMKETKDYIYFSLPQDFNANIRVSKYDEKSRRYVKTDYATSVKNLKEGGLDKPFVEDEEFDKSVDEQIEEEVGKNVQLVETDDNLPF